MSKYNDSSIIKARILSEGFRIDKNALDGLGTKYKEEHRGYDDSNWGISEDLLVPSEIMLPGKIVVGTHIRQDSPNLIKMEGDELYIFRDGKKLSSLTYLPRPKIWGKKLSDGTDIKKIVNFYGAETLNINIYSGCEFWECGLPCKFCSVSPTQKRYEDVLIKKTPAQIREAVKNAFSSGDPIKYVLTTGGSTLNPDTELMNHVKALNIIREFSPWKNKLKGNTALMPPLDLKKLGLLYDTGIEHPSFNLEVWGEKKFNEICPGKEKYRGFKKILKAYDFAIKNYYGEGALWCNFVAGINNLNELKEGFTHMANKGVIPGANIFHPDQGAILGKSLKSPSYEYIIELYHHAAELYHEKGYKPFFNESSLRNSLANEAFNGWI